MKRKRRKRRAPGTGCTIPRCRRLRYTEVQIGDKMRGVCAKHGADVLFAAEIRQQLDGDCWFRGDTVASMTCNGEIQCAHIVSRRYLATRWDHENAVPLCSAHHLYYTNHPLEWEERWHAHWGRMRSRALKRAPERPEDVIERLTNPGVFTAWIGPDTP